MKLGTHNTMTYKTPEQWYLKPLFFLARCQKLTWVQQYKNGVRWFDIRIRFTNDGKLHFGHGFFRYDAYDLDDFLYFMNNRLDDIYIRIVFEERKYDINSKYRNTKIIEFQNLCKKIEIDYPNIHFMCGQSVYTKETLYKFNNESNIVEHEMYSSVTSLFNSENKFLRIIDDICPWIYAKLKTKKLYNEYSSKYSSDENQFLILDFINFIN